MDLFGLRFDPHDPATWGIAIYALARVLSHVVPPQSWPGRAIAYVLGAVRPRAMVLVLLAALALPALAAPKYGAAGDGWEVGPRVAAPALAVDLKTAEVSLGILPGAGYGWTRTRGALAPWGLSAFLSVRSGASGLRPVASVTLDLLEYVHTGPALLLDGRASRAFWLVTLGPDLGSGPGGGA